MSAPADATSNTRTAAGEIVAELAERLTDPDQVAATVNTANGDRIAVDDVPVPPWDPYTLSRGPGALAMFYSELGRVEDRHRETAHRYLQLAGQHASDGKANGPLEGGLGALATAARIAAHGTDDYAAVLGRLDERVAGFARWLIAVHYATRDNGRPTCSGVVDATSGLAGVGRYLLHRASAAGAGADVLRDVLTGLVTLKDPVTVGGVEVPGWWYDATTKTRVDDSFELGQLNFGLAHGVPGPLALLSLAWSAGFRVPGQDEAIETMADWLLDWREYDESGRPYWTSYISLGYYTGRGELPAPRPARPSWCYGAAGIARALGFAGAALSRPEWTAAGLAAVDATLARPVERWSITDPAICHGWASSLYLFAQLSWEHPGVSAYAGAADAMAERVVAAYDPATVFGFRFYQPSGDVHLDLPGFLEGASGIALALHAYAAGRAPATEWDSVLLLR